MDNDLHCNSNGFRNISSTVCPPKKVPLRNHFIVNKRAYLVTILFNEGKAHSSTILNDKRVAQ